jgi:hypothetical protein
MLCGSIITFLLGQCGTLAGLAKVRMFGGVGGPAVLEPVLASWSALRWLILGGVLSAEIVPAVADFPGLHACRANSVSGRSAPRLCICSSPTEDYVRS